jgi:excinuclease ABC subunit A
MLLATLKRLRDLGNTVIVVEHDEDAIRAADYVVDLGPGAGVHGGEVVAEGTLADILANPDSLTGQYLTGARGSRCLPSAARAMARHHVRKRAGQQSEGRDGAFSAGDVLLCDRRFGSGKSTLTLDVAGRGGRTLNGARVIAGAHDRIVGLENCDKVIEIDQSPIGRTPRSNPATYTGAFTLIRDWFAGLPEAQARGYRPGVSASTSRAAGARLSGRRADQDRDALPARRLRDLRGCNGKRYNRETLEVKFKGHSIADVLDMTIEDAESFFQCAADP